MREAIASKLVPPAVTAEFAEVRRTVSQFGGTLRDDLAAFDPTLAAAADKSRRRSYISFRRSNSKTARETLKRNQRASRRRQLHVGVDLSRRSICRSASIPSCRFSRRHGVEIDGHAVRARASGVPGSPGAGGLIFARVLFGIRLRDGPICQTYYRTY